MEQKPTLTGTYTIPEISIANPKDWFIYFHYTHNGKEYCLALRCMASYVIIAHNHPSGTPTPSDADKEVTARIKAALESIEVPLNDHLIIIAGGWMSMLKEGLL